jgi:hypothetical protein
MAGEWAIYTKRHWWNHWVERQTYASLDLCEKEAEKIVKFPKYYFKWGK